jgi:hypothetical protein
VITVKKRKNATRERYAGLKAASRCVKKPQCPKKNATDRMTFGVKTTQRAYKSIRTCVMAYNSATMEVMKGKIIAKRASTRMETRRIMDPAFVGT